MNTSRITMEGLEGGRPGREATTGVHVPPGGGGPRRHHDGKVDAEVRTYYDLPVVNKPVWQAPDIPGYLFLGGLAGAGAVVGAAAQLTGRPGLARVSKLGAAAAGQLSLVALVHDLGRPGRFLNMLRVVKVTSPMSIGSWLLAGFVPAAGGAALADVAGLPAPLGAMATAAAAGLGLPVATYTSALIANTAVPAWHDGYHEMPFVFAASALSAASGLGLAGAPAAETGPLRPLASASGALELALVEVMKHRMGMVKEAFETKKAKRYLKVADAATATGAALAALAGRRRPAAVAAGVLLVTGSALTRFGIFEAGLASTEDPRYTVVPQRERLSQDGR